MANRKESRPGTKAISPSSKANLSILHGPAQPVPIHKTFGSLLREKAKSQPSALLVASDHQQKSLSYAEADSRSDDLARVWSP